MGSHVVGFVGPHGIESRPGDCFAFRSLRFIWWLLRSYSSFKLNYTLPNVLPASLPGG